MSAAVSASGDCDNLHINVDNALNVISQCFFDMYNLDVNFSEDKISLKFDYDMADVTSGRLIDLSRFKSLVDNVNAAADIQLKETIANKDNLLLGDLMDADFFLTIGQDMIDVNARLADALVNKSTVEISAEDVGKETILVLKYLFNVSNKMKSNSMGINALDDS